jgi:hypothetical protein
MVLDTGTLCTAVVVGSTPIFSTMRSQGNSTASYRARSAPPRIRLAPGGIATRLPASKGLWVPTGKGVFKYFRHRTCRKCLRLQSGCKSVRIRLWRPTINGGDDMATKPTGGLGGTGKAQRRTRVEASEGARGTAGSRAGQSAASRAKNPPMGSSVKNAAGRGAAARKRGMK